MKHHEINLSNEGRERPQLPSPWLQVPFPVTSIVGLGSELPLAVQLRHRRRRPLGPGLPLRHHLRQPACEL